VEKHPNGLDDRMDLFYGEIGKENQDDDGADRFEGVQLELKQKVGVTGRQFCHNNPLFSRRIEEACMAGSSLPCRAGILIEPLRCLALLCLYLEPYRATDNLAKLAGSNKEKLSSLG